jgi:TonB-linked SusC/RagA family outer membrane protein
MKKKLIRNIVAVLGLNILMQIGIYAQEGSITVAVNDESGNPIPGALVTVGEGISQTFTNENGEFTIVVKEGTPILIEAEGYESKLGFALPPPRGMGDVVLIKMPYLMGEKDRVHVPFGTLKARQIAGSVTVIDPDEILEYDQVGGYMGALNGRVAGMYGSNNIRGNGNPLVVVDGIPRAADDLNIQQIEQITVLKDLASSMMYGSQANNGVILITTKRGELLKKSLRVTGSYGVRTPISYPEYLSSADYMTLYNVALANDGLAPLYTEDAITATADGQYPVRYPDEGFFNPTYLKDWTTTQSIVGEASGGNEVARYYLNLGWNHDNSLLNLGEGLNEKEDMLNLRGNVNYKLNDNISIKFDGAFTLDIERGPRYNGDDFWGLASTLRPNYSPVLIPVDMVYDSALLETVELIDDQYILGGTNEFRNNPYGELTKNGNSSSISRLMQINTGLDYNLEFITPGLTGTAYISFDIFNGFNEALQNTYAVYNPVFTADDTISTAAAIGQDVRQDNKNITNVNFYRRVGFYGGLNYSRIFNSDHAVNANAIAYRDQYSTEGTLQPVKHLHFGVRANYTFANKYIAELTGVVAGSAKLFESTRYSFSPGVALGWVLSEEDFLSSSSLFDYLKIHANWAVNHTDENIAYYLYMANYFTQGGLWSYDQGAYSNRARNAFLGNPNLGWEKNMEISVGFESVMLDSRLKLEGGYFYNLASDLISTRANFYPAYFSNNIYENYGQEQNQGAELGINFTESVGDLKLSIGGNLVYTVPKVLVRDEPVYGENEQYLSRVGLPTDAMFGYVALGLFENQAEIDASPVQTFGVVRPGDIRYEDLNGDNKIDNLDVKMIGNSRSRLGYGININVEYKGLSLYALGTAQSGGDVYYNNAYYWVYGASKYSEVVNNAWTPATASTATYPRLTTTESSNNFRNSTYWIENRDWFRLQTVQLSYALPSNIGFIKDAQVFIRGNNLVTVSKISEKMELNIGSAPQFRTYSIGLKAAF